MAVREILVRNLSWKLLSLFLGILVWYFVSVGIQRGFTPFSRLNAVTFELPVFVLTSGTIPTAFEVRPARVNVTVRGRRDTVQRLSETDLVAYVDLSDVFTVSEVQRRVEVNLRWGTAEATVEPAAVRVMLRREDSEEESPRIELKLTP
jgi:YbbR domain-containing protein